MQPRGEPGALEPGVREPLEQCHGVGFAQPRERHMARMRLPPEALDQRGETLVGLELVAVRAHEEQRAARGLAREVVHELRACVVGPLQIVDHHHDLAPAGQGLEELHHRAEAPRLARLGKVGRQVRHRDALGHRGHQCRDLGERHRGELRQRLVRCKLERLAGEVDDGLIRHRALDLVAVGGERTEIARRAVAGELLHQPGLADAGLALEQHDVTRAGSEAREQPDQQAELGAATDEGGSLRFQWNRIRWRRVESRRLAASRPRGRSAPHRERLRAPARECRASAASRSARRREGRRSSASILRMAKREQLTAWASASWVRSSALRRRRSQYPKL